MSDVETAVELFEISEYSLPPSEADVTMNNEDMESVLSLMSCISDASEYSLAASEAVVEFSSTDEEDTNASSDETEDSFHSVLEELYPTGSISEYSMPASEADVEIDACTMLYPQTYITKLELSERADIDTPAPESF